MAKKINIEGKEIQSNEFYKAIRTQEGEYCVINKINGSYCYCVDYKIVGSALLVKLESGEQLYINHENMQEFGQGRSLAYTIEIDAWKDVKIENKVVTAIQYFDEKGFRFVRCLDEVGNFYKPNKNIKFEQETELTV